MLPTLMSSRNLPEISGRFPVRYRIATTPEDRKRIEEWPIFGRVAATVEIEWVTDKSSPDITYHIEWYKRSLADAKAANAICFMAYPDVAWSNGVLARCAEAIAQGKVGAEIPYIRVISETLVPEMIARAGDDPIEFSGGELVRLGMRHMHPLSVAALADGRHALPSLEVTWRVPDQGLLLREMSRELTLIDTERLEANQYWNTIKTSYPEALHVSEDSDDMLMLSVAPLFKDFQVYIPNHTLQPIDLARVSRHPDNNNPLVEHFAAHSIRLHYDDFDEKRWDVYEQRADDFIGQALFLRQFLSVWEAARVAGCSLAAQAISVALNTTSLTARLRCDGPMTAFIPNDEAFGERGWEALAPLLRSEQANELESAVLNYIVPGVRDADASASWEEIALGGMPLHVRNDGDASFVNEARILHRIELSPHQICVIDRLLQPIAPAMDFSPSLGNPQNGSADTDTATTSQEAAPRPSSSRGDFSKLGRGLFQNAAAIATKIHTAASRFMREQPISLDTDEKIAQQYPLFLRHFNVDLAGSDLERQKRAAATTLYQAGLYRHKLLFLFDLMSQFSALGGVTDPRPAFFDYCSSLVGGERDLLRADRYYRLALQLVPNFAEASYARGLLARRAGASAEAMALFKAAACTSPHPRAVPYAHIAANAWRNLAEFHRDSGNHEIAEACLRKALFSHGSHGVYQVEIAKFLHTRGHIPDAVQQYELTMPYSHIYPCEFSEPNYAKKEKLPADLDGNPCDPLKPTVISEDTQGVRLLCWWHLHLRVPPKVEIDSLSLLKLRPQGTSAMMGL